MSDALTPHGSPGASTGAHAIAIRANGHRVRVIHGGVTMADTRKPACRTCSISRVAT
jgi:uncharacterized protein (DUF427 family)